MAEIKSREQTPIAGIEYSEIIIPDEKELGTGTFTTVLKPDAMAKISPIISTIINEPVFKLMVNILFAEKEVTVLLGKADKSPPLAREVFQLPEGIELSKVIRFDVIFGEWKIKGLEMDGKNLDMVPVK